MFRCFRSSEGDFSFVDAMGHRRVGHRKLESGGDDQVRSTLWSGHDPRAWIRVTAL